MTALRIDLLARIDTIEAATVQQIDRVRIDANPQVVDTRTAAKSEIAKVTTPAGTAAVEQVRIRLLEDFVTASKSADKTRTIWSDHTWPIARWFVGMLMAVLIVLVLGHASIFAPQFKP